MFNLKNLLSFLVVMLGFHATLLAAEPGENLWTTGKIYVVLGVLITIFTGIIIFLLVLERKIRKLERKLTE